MLTSVIMCRSLGDGVLTIRDRQQFFLERRKIGVIGLRFRSFPAEPFLNDYGIQQRRKRQVFSRLVLANTERLVGIFARRAEVVGG